MRTYAPRGSYALDSDGNVCDVIEVVAGQPEQTYLLQVVVAGLPVQDTVRWAARGEVKAWSYELSTLLQARNAQGTRERGLTEGGLVEWPT